MNFKKKEIKEIKGEANSLRGYTELLKEEYVGNIEDILNRDINIFTFKNPENIRFIMTHNNQQIGDCKAVLNNETKEYFMSSIAILPNIQQKGLGNDFFKKIFKPYFEENYPEYIFEKAPKQTELGKKYVISREKK